VSERWSGSTATSSRPGRTWSSRPMIRPCSCRPAGSR
jgi:hypothetical protein